MKSSTLRKVHVNGTENEMPLPPVEKGIPIPTQQRAKKYNFGFERLKMNESIFIPLVKDLTIESQRQNVMRYVGITKDQFEGDRNFTTRLTENEGTKGFRVWRIEA